MADRSRVTVELGERSYQILIGTGLLASAGELMARLRPTSTIVISDRLVAPLYGSPLLDSLRAAGLTAHLLQVPRGERSKSISRAVRLWGELLELGADRGSMVVALGGGVVGDLAGFVAATYMRGIRLVQVPTTLLAQVDSSVGGKVAVDHPRAKNLIGAFCQPAMVVADVETLRSLPPRQLQSGLAEVVKHGAIADPELFAYLEEHAGAALRAQPEVLWHLVRRSCEIKAEVVHQDEREETGWRAILNFGHTTGHALETVGGYRRISHGQAVAVGMVVAARVAVRMGIFPPREAARLGALLRRLRLPVAVPGFALCQPEEVLQAALHDKKAVAGRLRMVLPRRLGQVELFEVPPALLRDALLAEEMPGEVP